MANNQWIIEDSQPIAKSESPETYGQQLKRIGAASGLSALRGLESVVSFIPETLLGRKAPHPKPSEIIQENAGLSDEYLQPRNTAESFIQRLSSSAPLAATGGLGALGRAAAGSAAATGVERAGLPEPIQDIAQLGTELGLGLRQGKIPTIRGAQKIEDSLARAAVKPGTHADASLIRNAINSVEKELGTEVSEKYSKKIIHALKTVEENLTSGKIDPIKAVDLRKKLYKLSRELPADVSIAYVDPLTKGINNFFSVYAAENPAFYKHLSARDKLTSFRHMNSFLGEGIKKLSLEKLPFGEVAGKLVNNLIGNAEKTIRGIATNSQVRRYYFDAVKSLAKGDPSLFAKNINKMAEIAPELAIEEDKPSDQWIID